MFSQITGKEINFLVIFRVIFCLDWPFKTPEYTSFIVIFFRKAHDHDFLFWFFNFLEFSPLKTSYSAPQARLNGIIFPGLTKIVPETPFFVYQNRVNALLRVSVSGIFSHSSSFKAKYNGPKNIAIVDFSIYDSELKLFKHVKTTRN